MNILYITPKINNEGGVARVLSVKANYLVEKFGYEVHILTQNEGNSSLFFPFNDNITLHDIVLQGNRFAFFLQYVKALNKTIQNINPDLIIVCDNGLKGYTIPFILKTKIPIIFECHGSKYIEETPQNNYFSGKKIKLAFKEFSANKFAKFIALSSESLNEWNVRNGVVIPNPLWFETNKFADLKSKKIMAVGRHSYEKGFDRLINIWKKVLPKHPDWHLEIYGKSSENEELQHLANAQDFGNKLSFFEPVINIVDKYKEASVVVMTSRTEGFGMVLIEAMACGLPCVAYDCPVGPRSIIVNSENGFLVEDGNENLFIEKLNLLIENENLRIEMGRSAKENSYRYTIDVIMLQWKNLFENLVKN